MNTMTPYKSYFRKKSRGFTLLEVVVSMLVLTFGILGTVAFTMTSMRGNKESLKRVDAAAMSMMLMARLFGGAVDWDDLGTGPCGTTGTVNRVCETNAVVNAHTYHLYFIVCYPDSDEPIGTFTDLCNLPASSLLAGNPKPAELACKPLLDADGNTLVNEREVIAMVVWAGDNGDCNHYVTRNAEKNPNA